MTVVPGAWQCNTNYSVSVTVTHKIFSDVFAYQLVNFTTQAPPRDGDVIIKPKTGRFGGNITLDVIGWKTSNPNVTYSVYETTNKAGNLTGKPLNAEPIRQGIPFKYVMGDFPVLLVITDNSTEVVRRVIMPEAPVVVVKPAANETLPAN
jgi:hypothetical protein